MTVISNDYGDNWENAEEETNVKDQRGWLVLSPLARQVVVTSGHDVPRNEPDLTVRDPPRPNGRPRLMHCGRQSLNTLCSPCGCT
jgi:hypothetical protein